MYIVAECLLDGCPYLARTWIRESLAEAQDLAVAVAWEQLGESTVFRDENSVRKEIEENDALYDPNNQWSVCIGLAEDDGQ